MTHESPIGKTGDHDPIGIRPVVINRLVNHSKEVARIVYIPAEEAACLCCVPAFLTKPVLCPIRVEQQVLILVNAVEEVHVLCIALAAPTETMERHNERQWLGVIVTPRHPEQRVPALLADRRIGMLISVVSWAIPIIRATCVPYAVKLRQAGIGVH